MVLVHLYQYQYQHKGLSLRILPKITL